MIFRKLLCVEIITLSPLSSPPSSILGASIGKQADPPTPLYYIVKVLSVIKPETRHCMLLVVTVTYERVTIPSFSSV